MVSLNDVRADLIQLLEIAEAMVTDLGDTVSEIIREGIEQPLGKREALALLDRVIQVMRSGAEQRGDSQTIAIIDREAGALVARIEAIKTRLETEQVSGSDENVSAKAESSSHGRLQLQEYNGIEPAAVRPIPIFHEQPVPVNEGFVRTRDIRLWDENERLDIHLNQFQQKYGSNPAPDQLLAIMQGEMTLPGMSGTDQFEIQSLAKSIAVNGVRKPPIIDTNGTLLDGNRRVTACYYILNSTDNEFPDTAKKRVEWIKVWQLTEHATEQERDAVIVSLNFEPDNKQDWPEYVKAQKVFEHYEEMVTLEPRANPPVKRLKEIRTEIARKFAIKQETVSRYISMVKMAREFEEYHVVQRSKDKYESKHRASDKFQYFDELNKGKNPGGVNYALNQDERFKHLIYDLLYDDKFANWRQIRDLRYIPDNEDAMELLRKARQESDLDTAQEHVEHAIGVVRLERAERRQTGADTRIKTFTKWFLNLPVKAFDSSEPGAIKNENLLGLAEALKLVETHLKRNAAKADDNAE